MKNELDEIKKLLDKKKIKEAQVNLSKLGSEFHRNPDYLYLRGKLFYLNKLYYIAIDTLLISLEFSQNEEIYKLISEIYNDLGNNELSKKLNESNLRLKTVNSLKDEMSGIYKKNID
tara:strand:- start:730 stop:1080 length:351 start_codon:yes stop_codon:yes gene_type:complete